MKIILVQPEEIQQMLQAIIKPLFEEIQVLRNMIEFNGKPLTVKQFAEKSGYGITKVRELLKEGRIGFSQTGDGGKITIPAKELLKLRQV